MTPHGFSLALDGRRRRRVHEMETLAWIQANLINVHLRKRDRIEPRDIWSETPRVEKPRFYSKQELVDYMLAQERQREDN